PPSRGRARALGCRRARRHAVRPGLHDVPPGPLRARPRRTPARGGGPAPDVGAGRALRARRPRTDRARVRRRPRAVRPGTCRHPSHRGRARPAARAAPAAAARGGHRHRPRERRAARRAGRADDRAAGTRAARRPGLRRGRRMRTDADAREQIIQITNELFAMGLLTATGGNVSALGADTGKYWITPSRMYKGGLTADDLVCITPDGMVCEGSRTPSVEYQMHW